jgi:phage FluMu protein Com
MNEASDEVVYLYVNCHKCKKVLRGPTIAHVVRWKDGSLSSYPIVKCARCGAARSITSANPTEARALHPEDDNLFPAATG